jgi:hypothetical protein
MGDAVTKIIPTPRGDGRAMTELKPSTIGATYGVTPATTNVNFSYTGADWFGPLPPMRPTAPPEVAGRAWDFAPGYNLTTTPRANAPVSFATLRALAEGYDPLRLIIERRKDQISRLQWTIRVKHEGAGKRAKAAELTPAMRSLVKDVTYFFERPSFDFTFRSWLRALVEDALVIDAASCYCERDRSGTLMGLSPIDGALIKRVIDSWGRTPRPFPWNGEAFDWCGEQVTAQNFTERGFKYVNGMAFPPAYQQILKGLPAINYTTNDLVYRPMNLRTNSVFGFSPVEQIMMTVSIATRRSFSQLEYFREGNQPDALFALPATWTPDQTQRFQDYWDSLYSGNLANRRRMKFIAGDGRGYVPLKEPPLKSEFDEWLVRIVCFAFSYPPTAFINLANRSIAEEHTRSGEREGLEPLKQWAAELINEVISDEFSDAVEFAWVEEDEIDPEKQAKILSTLVAGGILSPNEARERLGEEPDASPAASRLAIKTSTGLVPIDGSNTMEDDT